jgi:hypothetical protein
MNLIECTDKLIELGYSEQVQKIFDNRTNKTGYRSMNEPDQFETLPQFIDRILYWRGTKEGQVYWCDFQQELFRVRV